MRARALFICVAIIGFATTLPAQDKDVEGSKDHPMVSRFPGYVISDYDTQGFGAYEFQVGQGEQRVEGRYWKIEYTLKEGAKKGGPLEIGRNYANTFTQRGGQKLLEDLDSGGGRLTARMPAAGKNIWLNEKGSVAIHGILFDTGKTTIKAESKTALAPIGELLKNDATLKLEIQGHTDVVSTFTIASDWLTTAGFGDTKPVGDNKTDGRRANRRVELVKK